MCVSSSRSSRPRGLAHFCFSNHCLHILLHQHSSQLKKNKLSHLSIAFVPRVIITSTLISTDNPVMLMSSTKAQQGLDKDDFDGLFAVHLKG